MSQVCRVIVLSSFLIGINKKRSLFPVLSGVVYQELKCFGALEFVYFEKFVFFSVA